MSLEYIKNQEVDQKRQMMLYAVAMALVALGVVIAVLTYG